MNHSLRLSQGLPNQVYRVSAIEGPEVIEQRLIAMGFVRGSLVHLLKRTLGKQTLAVSVDGVGMLLRTEEAAGITVQPDRTHYQQAGHP